ncbi:MAG: hypothetical protein RLZZ219_169, partial [Cyanobacteriota bacterium]
MARSRLGGARFGPSQPSALARRTLTQLSASPADLLPQSDLPQSCLSQSCLPENCLPELGVAPCDLPPTAPGAGAETCSLDTIQQTMERLPGGCRRLAVQLRTALDPQWLWAVLT